MRSELEQTDIEAIANLLLRELSPLLTEGRGVVDRKEILDVPGVAEYLGVEESWIYKQVQYKAIPYFKIGKYLRFRLKDLERWISEQAVPAVSSTYPQLVTARAASTRNREKRRNAA